jgi:hypothetical protein
MLQQLINRSPDLKKLRDEGFEIEVRNGGHLIVHHIPYVNNKRAVEYGKLIALLTINNDIAKYQKSCNKHVIYFMGSYPCNKDGSEITSIRLQTINRQLFDDIVMNFSFSNKPQNDYNDYYEQVLRYYEIISSPAKSIDGSITAQTFKVIDSKEDDNVFQYIDTNSSRANIYNLNDKFRNLKIAIIGLGGTGSYILDLVVKTPVSEIHLYDGDNFLQHNAFRSPGVPNKETLNLQKPKVEYFTDIYSNMHKGIISHFEYVKEENIQDLANMSFVFVCVDKNSVRNLLVNYLVPAKIPFIDVGMEVNLVNDCLIGTVRTTTVTSQKNDHIQNRIPMSNEDDENNEYSSNIQIADLNALNAVFAVIKWKKLCGFYQDIPQEYHSAYSINDSNLVNDEKQHNT